MPSDATKRAHRNALDIFFLVKTGPDFERDLFDETTTVTRNKSIREVYETVSHQGSDRPRSTIYGAGR